MKRAAARVAHEDLVVFLNACFACTGQREFYSDGHQQTVSIAFLHEYIRGNDRRLYARSLAAGVNHFNQGRIVLELLSHSKQLTADERREEGQLCRAVLAALPPQRAYRVLLGLRERGVNNRRTRAIVREFLAQRPDLAFDARLPRVAPQPAVRLLRRAALPVRPPVPRGPQLRPRDRRGHL